MMRIVKDLAENRAWLTQKTEESECNKATLTHPTHTHTHTHTHRQ